jgi:nucleoid DNA-binding protein
MSTQRNQLINQYYQKVKHLYPTLSEDDFHTTILNSFKYFRQRMISEDLPKIRLKGFGSFQVFTTPVLAKLKEVKREVDFRSAQNYNIREDDMYVKQLNILNAYVERNEESFKKAAERRNTFK